MGCCEEKERSLISDVDTRLEVGGTCENEWIKSLSIKKCIRSIRTCIHLWPGRKREGEQVVSRSFLRTFRRIE